jgi:hypothetical protein
MAVLPTVRHPEERSVTATFVIQRRTKSDVGIQFSRYCRCERSEAIQVVAFVTQSPLGFTAKQSFLDPYVALRAPLDDEKTALLWMTG